MPQQELLKYVVETLEVNGIQYMVTGSVASSLHGEPRSSHDIDLVVSLKPADVPLLVRSFGSPEFYLDGDTALEAIRTRGMFNVIDVPGGEKVDFWLLTPDEFDVSRFARRKHEPFDSFYIWVSTPEDTILAKLRWAKFAGGSEKQIQDAAGICELQGKSLDQHYLSLWVAKLAVDSEWQAMLQRANSSGN